VTDCVVVSAGADSDGAVTRPVQRGHHMYLPGLIRSLWRQPTLATVGVTGQRLDRAIVTHVTYYARMQLQTARS